MPQNKLTTPILKSKLKDHKTLKSKLLKLINEAPFPLDQSNNNTYLKIDPGINLQVKKYQII